MEISSWYRDHFEADLKGRYIHLKSLIPLLKKYHEKIIIESAGQSELGSDIPYFIIGNGSKKVLAWSQMHGNESTTTKAIFDILAFLCQDKVYQEAISTFLQTYTLYCIPILNPDGAIAYTRANTNGIDLNRDAINKTQSETQALWQLFNEIQPDLCLNLHDQRTLYSLPTGKGATVSFLAPSANAERSLTPARKEAMILIAKMTAYLETLIPGAVGRYDDSFNEHCIGDSFQKAGVPTILFEAGHVKGDYARERTREYIYYGFLSLFDIIETDSTYSVRDYLAIPENQKFYRDVILRDVCLDGKLVDVAIQYEEKLLDDAIYFEPYIDKIGDLSNYLTDKEVAVGKTDILLNSHENVFETAKVSTVVNKNAINEVFFKDSCITF
ncbi:MAG: peptidase M14 [Bacteroidetes bacterium]|nr:peptidase M14 [Bacteroidota bacterium]